MKVFGLLTRNIPFILISSCLLFLVCASPAHAQSNPTNYLQLTPATGFQVGSAWYTNPGEGGSPQTQPLANGFSTTFTFQLSPGSGADGFAFVVQNGRFAANNTSGIFAVGPSDGLGGEIGFTGLTQSVAVQFDIYHNSEYSDIPASGPTSTDQITVESCGTGGNTVNHNGGCEFGTTDLSALGNPIYLGDGKVHTAQITYRPPPTPGDPCARETGALPNSDGCGSIVVVLDGTPVLTVGFNLGSLGLDQSGDAFVGFTAATGALSELQNILSWNFALSGDFSYPPFPTTGATGLQTNGSASVIVIQTVSTTTANTSTFNPNPAALVQETLDFRPAAGNLVCNTNSEGGTGSCPTNLQLQSANSLVPSDGTFGSYVVGTPFATAQCLGHPGNGATNPCSLYVNACFGGNIAQAQADDFYCPFVNPETPGSSLINILDTWEPVNPKPDPSKTPGTTFSSIVFVPSSPGETWSPSPTSPNPVCPNPDGTSTTAPPATNAASGGNGCDFSDSLVEVYGDQTTTRGSKPKKGWVMSVSNVYEPLSNVSANGVPINSPPSYSPGFSANLWFKPPINLNFLVNPACPLVNTYPCAITSSAYNFFKPAPVAGENYAVTRLSDGSVIIPLTPATPPANFSTQSAEPIAFTANPTLSDGQYYLQFGASDNVGINERSIQVVPASGPAPGTCPVPSDAGGGTVSGAPQGTCYVTLPFETELNVDGTAPTIASAGFSPAGSPAGTFSVGQTVYPIYTCSDNLSGLQACGGIPVVCPLVVGPSTLTSTAAINTTAPGPHSYTVTATDCAGNVSAAATVSYVVAPSVDLQIKTLPFLTLSTGIPGFLPVTYGAAITDLGSSAATDVTVTTTFSNIPSGVVLGNASATISTVTCSNSPCTLKGITISTSQCSVSWPKITCSVPTLGPLASKTGLWMEIIVPVARNSKAGKFTSTSTVMSAGTDPNPGNNTTMQTYTIF
jgi:hypothetical protein